MDLPYNPSSAESILQYGKKLLGKSLRQLHEDAYQYSSGRGGLGQSIEKCHFKIAPNSVAEPDFADAGVELKSTPLKVLEDGSTVSKERLVLNIIDYLEEAERTFETSSFWHKNKLLLLMFYLHESNVDVIDLIFKIIRLWEFPEEDLKIIKDDWAKLHWKMANGLAHEISEGDTFYLGACPKGSRAGEEMRAQKGTDIRAQQRAYSIKSRYLNNIILDSMLHPEMCDGVRLTARQLRKIEKIQSEAESIIKSIDEYEEGETFEQLIERRFRPFYGKKIYEIEARLGKEFSNSPKAISYDVIRGILGINNKKIKEFELADVMMKSIRLQPSGSLKESMSFPVIKYDEIVNENQWEDSFWHSTLTKRFLFIVFRKSESNVDKEAVLEKVFFWTMPSKDLSVAKEFWADTKAKVCQGVFNNFYKASDQKICHVRPKAKNSADTVDTPFGPQRKLCYWLNRDYIVSVLSQNL